MADGTTLTGSWHDRARRVLAGGVSSSVRLANPPLIVDRAEGARLWDVHGRDYVDHVLGQGPALLGHAPRAVREAVEAAQRRGTVYAATHRTEIEAAERLLQLLGRPDHQVRFGGSSSEMVQAALRVARHATGRRTVLRFHGHYHGWFDTIHIRTEPDGDRLRALPAGGGQLADALDHTVTAEWNDPDAFARAVAEHGDDLAAVLMEPVMLNTGSVEPNPGYLAAVREACTARGIVLILDETITGFRLAPGGAAQRYGIRPDLAVYGKAMAGGWPCSALVGRPELLAGVASGEVVHSGTFNGNTVATAAALACMEQLADGRVHRHLESYGRRLADGLRGIFAEHGLGFTIQGPPMAFHVRATGGGAPATGYRDVAEPEAALRYARFAHALAEHGVWAAPRGIWYVSAAHGERDLDDTLTRTDTAARAFRGTRGATA